MIQKIGKFFFPAVIVIFSVSCNQKTDHLASLEKQIDSMSKRIDSTFSPGLGEFMVSIQLHHAKLWFAGKNGNWELANFETGEIQEDLDNIQHYNRDRPEIKELPMIFSPLDSLKSAVAKKDPAGFNRGYILLTNTCNNCHQVTKHGFNKIKIPESLPVTNQVFDKP